MVELVEQRQRVGAGRRIDHDLEDDVALVARPHRLERARGESTRKRGRDPATSAGRCCPGCPCPQPPVQCIAAKSIGRRRIAGEELENAGDVDRIVVAGRIGVADALRKRLGELSISSSSMTTGSFSPALGSRSCVGSAPSMSRELDRRQLFRAEQRQRIGTGAADQRWRCRNSRRTRVYRHHPPRRATQSGRW